MSTAALEPGSRERSGAERTIVDHRVDRRAHRVENLADRFRRIEAIPVRELDSRQRLVVVGHFADGPDRPDVPDDDVYRQAGFIAEDFEEGEVSHG